MSVAQAGVRPRRDTNEGGRCAEKRAKPLYEHVQPNCQLEDLLFLNATLVSCDKGLQPVNQPLFDALVASFRKCGQQQVPESKVNDKAQALYNQVHIPR